jgi:hypothetical protein
MLGVAAAAGALDIVAYLPRAPGPGPGAFNGGRRVANEDAVLDALAAALRGRRERLEARPASRVRVRLQGSGGPAVLEHHA